MIGLFDQALHIQLAVAFRSCATVRPDFAPQSQTDRNRDRHIRAADDGNRAFVNDPAQPLCCNFGLRQRRIRQRDQKLFAADPRHHVDRAQIVAQAGGHIHQDRIAHGMAPGIVDGFEPIQVENHHGKGAAGLLRPFGNTRHMRHRIAAVVKPGQRVDHSGPQPIPHRGAQSVGLILAAQLGVQAQRHLTRVGARSDQVIGTEVQRHDSGGVLFRLHQNADGRMACAGTAAQFGHQLQTADIVIETSCDQEHIRCHSAAGFSAARFRNGGDRQRLLPVQNHHVGRQMWFQPASPGHCFFPRCGNQRHGTLPFKTGSRFGKSQFTPGGVAQLQLILGFARPEQAANPRGQHHFVMRLGHEFIGTGFQCAHPRFDVGQGGHHDHRNVAAGRIRFQPAAYLDPIHFRQKQVQQDKVGIVIARQFKGFFASLCLQGFIAGLRQLDLQDDAVCRDIVNNQDSP